MSLVALMAEATMAALRWPKQALWMADHLAYAALVPVFFRKYQLVQSVVWDRDVLGMGAHFRKQTEFGIYARSNDAPDTTETKRDIVRLRPAVKKWHPAEKPLGLMDELLRGLTGAVICDPYCGSGTTLLAAKRAGRTAVGIEIEERYCEIAAKRLEQEVLNLNLLGVRDA
jgi:2-polyprenyl-3-methyl-5-hydroxy-6-metoxy-1,4-benzoquinol methylase